MATLEEVKEAVGIVQRYVQAIHEVASTLSEDYRALRIRIRPAASPWPLQPEVTTGSCSPWEPGGCLMFGLDPNPGYLTVEQFLAALQNVETSLANIRKAIGPTP